MQKSGCPILNPKPEEWNGAVAGFSRLGTEPAIQPENLS